METSKAVDCLRTHPDAELRRQSAEMLISGGELGRESIIALAKGLTDSDLGVKDICGRALSSSVGENALIAAECIAPLITDNNIEIRNLAGDILLSLRENSIPALLPFLQDKDEDNRKFALDILGLIAGDEILGDVFPLLFDEDANVKCSAVDAIGNIRAEVALDELIRIYFIDDDLKPNIIEAIAKIGGTQAQSFLSERLNNEDDLFLQTACIDALSICGEDFGICLELFSNLPDTPTELKTILLKTIYAIAFRIGETIEMPENLRYIAISALGDDDPDIRAAGLIALGNVYDMNDIEALINETLRNYSETQQHIVFNLMAYSAPEVCSEFFIRFLGSSTPDGSDIEFLGILGSVWESANISNRTAVINTIIDNLLQIPRGNAQEIMEILLLTDRDIIINKFTDIIHSGNESHILELLDHIIFLDINELITDLEGFSTDNPLLQKSINQILSAFSKKNNMFQVTD